MKALSEKGHAVAPMIDHTLLKAEAGKDKAAVLCGEAIHYGFAAVCVHPVLLPFIAERLSGSEVRAGTVVGFPFGAQSTETKEFETRDAVRKGAQELDMVLAVARLKDREYAAVRDDIRAVVKAAEGRTTKVILETCLLTDEEKVTACRIAMEAGISFVKTSTGLAAGGATVEDVRLMRKTVGSACGVKASGGIRTLEDALRMIEAGANRIGTSSGVGIVT